MTGWGMGLGGLWMLVIAILVGLIIAALIKQRRRQAQPQLPHPSHQRFSRRDERLGHGAGVDRCRSLQPS